ncbi:MAG: tRNA 2-thiouridine(34) synthase MnmA [Clostridiales bacterium]|nr:tRNA 2-thiouridine(34) synthase MnmA [Clostridiales bacterium]
MNKKVVLGLSGGVDSALAAHLLQKQGYELYGLYMDIGTEGAKNDAVSAALSLGIPLEIRDTSEELEEKVCAPFVSAYLRGETPNPCVLCNRLVKFKVLCDHADEIGADFIATGHYARTINGALYKGHPENDQSYMLCRIKPRQLARLLLPLGEYSKNQVRALAHEFLVPAAEKPASMEICFIPDKDYAAYIEKRGVYPPEGNFVDERGRVLGRHRGIHRYTIGQRRGLNFSAGKRVYVSEIRPETNEIVLSEGEALMTGSMKVHDINWLIPQEGDFSAEVRVRHSKTQTQALISPKGNSAEVFFKRPVRAPTSGQTAVFYKDDLVLGGGFIV